MTGRFQLSFPEPRRRDGWFRIGNIDITTTAMLCLLAVGSMVLYALSKTAFWKLAFDVRLVRSGELWRLVTWPIANPPGIFVVISIVFFWIFGHATEEMVGKKRFLGLVGLITVVPAALVSLFSVFQSNTAANLGVSLLGTVMLVLFAADRPNALFFLGIPAWIIAAVFVGIDLLQLLADRLWGSIVQLLLMLGLALVMMRQWGHLTELTMIPRFSKGGGRKKSAGRRKQSRDFDRVVSGPWPAPTLSDQAEMDRLLDKMNSVGLSDAERKRLSELGKRLRGN